MGNKKIAIATVAANTEYYYKSAKLLLENFLNDDELSIFVYTDNEGEFLNLGEINIIKHDFTTNFNFHKKFVFINEIRKQGYDKICYIDADMILVNGAEFINEIKSFKFNDGFSYTRFTSVHFRALLNTNPKLLAFKDELIKNDIEFRHTNTPWEDLMFFNFENIEKERVDILFKKYEEYYKLREKCANLSKDDLRGEGAVFGLAITNTEFPSTVSSFLYKQLKYFRDNHHPAYEDIPCLSSEACIMIHVKNTQDNYEKLLDTTINFYKKQFDKPSYIVVETNNKETLREKVINEYNSEYFFVDSSVDTPDHDAIKIALEKNNKTVLFYVESGCIILDSRNIKNNFEMILRKNYDYIIPFISVYYLPEFLLNNDDSESKAFLIDIKKYKSIFESNPWKTHKDRHESLLKNDLSYKYTLVELICLDINNPVIKKRLM